jgi:hypothetical protein
MGFKITQFDASIDSADAIDTSREATVSDFSGGSGGLEIGAAYLDASADRLFDANIRIEKRKDTVSRTISETDFSDTVAENAQTLTDTADLHDPAVASQFAEETRALVADAMSKHTGSDESLALLQNALTRQASAAIQNMNKASLAAGRAFIKTDVTKNQAMFAEEAGATGDVQLGFDRNEDYLAGKVNGMSSAETATALREGNARVLRRVFDTADEGGDEDGMAAILDRPDVAQYIDPKELRSMRGSLLTLQGEREKGRIEGEQALEKMATILNKDVSELTDTERAIEAGTMNPEGKTKTQFLQGLNDARVALGQPQMTPDQIDRALNIYDSDPAVTFTKAGSRSITTNIGPRIVAGTATAQEQNEFIAATTELSEIESYIDPGSGLQMTRQPELTQMTKDALAMMGVNPNGSPIGSPTSTTDPTPGGESTGLDIEAPSIPQDETAWALADIGTGMASSAASALAHTPVLGEIFPAHKVVQARSQLTSLSAELVSLLRVSQRADKERQELALDVGIKPEWFTTITAYKDGLVGLDNTLKNRMDAATKILNTDIPLKERQFQMRFLSMAAVFRDKLRVPKKYDTYAEANQAGLKPGTEIRIGDGYFIVPGAQ